MEKLNAQNRVFSFFALLWKSLFHAKLPHKVFCDKLGKA